METRQVSGTAQPLPLPVAHQQPITAKKTSNKGFTLVELLVVISILAILAVIGFSALGAVLKGGRDAKRQSDIKTIQSALEQYHADGHFYPSEAGMVSALSNGTSFTNATGGISEADGQKVYLKQLPKESSSSNPRYTYKAEPEGCDNNSSTKCQNYCLYAKLENSSSAIENCADISSYNFEATKP